MSLSCFVSLEGLPNSSKGVITSSPFGRIKKCKRIKIKYKNMNLTWLFYILFLYKQKPAIAYKSILLNWSHIYMPCTSLSETRMVCAFVEFPRKPCTVIDHVGVVWLMLYQIKRSAKTVCWYALVDLLLLKNLSINAPTIQIETPWPILYTLPLSLSSKLSISLVAIFLSPLQNVL